MIIDIKDSRDFNAVRASLTQARKNKQKIGLTSGCYDLFHSLHLTYLQRCRRMCDILIVGIDSDDLVRQTKGPERPIISEHQRINLVSALKCVDLAFIMGSVKDFEAAVVVFEPDLIFKNQNFRPQDVVGKELATVVIVPDVFQADSTSGIIEKIKTELVKAGAPSRIAAAPVTSTPSAIPASGGPRAGDLIAREARTKEQSGRSGRRKRV